MQPEAYSARMHEEVQHEVQHADTRRLAELATYYRHRGGPGRELVAAELRRRLACWQLNYSKPAS